MCPVGWNKTICQDILRDETYPVKAELFLLEICASFLESFGYKVMQGCDNTPPHLWLPLKHSGQPEHGHRWHSPCQESLLQDIVPRSPDRPSDLALDWTALEDGHQGPARHLAEMLCDSDNLVL